MVRCLAFVKNSENSTTVLFFYSTKIFSFFFLRHSRRRWILMGSDLLFPPLIVHTASQAPKPVVTGMPLMLLIL